jgi:cyclohexanecarboxylate-CoA ligase
VEDFGMWDSLVPVDPSRAAEYYRRGWWRHETFADDLAGHVRERPQATALISYQQGEPSRTLSYTELGGLTERFAGALIELGVGKRDVVVAHLPNWWMLTPLYLACARIGAVIAPLLPAMGDRELGHVLRTSGAKVCIVASEYAGTDFGKRLLDVAPGTLAHRVVVGDAGATGAIDFGEFFTDTPWEERHPVTGLPRPDPDDVALLVFTSGTTGQPKAVAHTFNTLFAASRAFSDIYGLSAQDVVLIPHFLTHLAGSDYAICMSVALGATCVMQDTMDMGLLLDLVAAHAVTLVFAAPVFMKGIVAAQRETPRDISSLRYLNSSSAPIPPWLVGAVREVLGLRLDSNFGMTECGAITITRAGDPVDWAAHSDGSAVDWTEVRIDAGPGERVGRLLTRGASQCLGYVGQRDAYTECLDADGWFDTGDMARADGRGGIRITGRRTDLIVRSRALKVPALEVETVLESHPAINEVILVGYPDPVAPEADRVCAVVVAQGAAPSLPELTRFLAEQQMTELYWPDRLELVPELPRNPQGKVLRRALRDLATEDSGGQQA